MMCTVQGVGLKFGGSGGNFSYDGSPAFGCMFVCSSVNTKVSYTVNQLATMCAVSS